MRKFKHFIQCSFFLSFIFSLSFFQVFRRITYECTGGSLGGVEGMLGVDSAGKLIYTDV